MNEYNASLTEQLFRLVLLLNRYHHHNRGDGDTFGDTHRGQGRVLALLKLKPEITQKELTYLLNMRNQSLGELLGKLEKNGFITRSPSEEDRRVMNVKLTEAGLEAANQAEQRKMDNGKLYEVLSEEEQEKLGEYLDRLIANLRQQVDAEGADDRERALRELWDGRGGRHHRPFGPHGRGRGPGDRFQRMHGDPSFHWGHGRPSHDGRFGGPNPRPERDSERH